MLGPLSLRLCCLAAMAPALTETANQARVTTLSPTKPESGQESNGIDSPGITINVLETKQRPILHTGKSDYLAQNHIFANLSQSQITQLGTIKNLPELFKAKRCNSELRGRMNTANGKMVSDIENMGFSLPNGSRVPQAKVRSTNGDHTKSDSSQVDSKGIDQTMESKEDAESSPNVNITVCNSKSEANTVTHCENINVTCEQLPPVGTVNMKRRQQVLERRADRLSKRIRRLQSVQTSVHVRSQLTGFVDSQHKNLESMATAIKVPSSTDIKPDMLQSDDIKNLSTAALVNLVRRLQSSQVTLRQRLQATSHSETNSVLSLDEETASDVEHVAGCLHTNLSHLESNIDSDVTESSSGGESCDEEYGDTESKYHPPLQRRAEWKWASDRSNVAARWTWLQAQVSDLEYRIRQQTEIYKQIRQTKGLVVLGDPPSPEDLMSKFRPSKSGRKLSPIEAKISAIEKRNEMSPCNISTLLHNVDKQSSKLTKSLGNCYSPVQANSLQTGSVKATAPVVNGVLDSSHSSQSSVESLELESEDPLAKKPHVEQTHESSGTIAQTVEASSPGDSTCKASRCRPVKMYRKRKILRTAGLHLVHRKTAKLSTVKCHCYSPLSSCALCGGRYNNCQAVDPYGSTVTDRVALLDPSFHHILSFKQDIPLPIHFEALLKSGEWQNKPTLKSSKCTSVSSDKKKSKRALDGSIKKSAKKLSKSATAAMMSSTKFRNKNSRSHSGSLPGTPKNSLDGRVCRTEIKKRKAQLARGSLKKHRTSSLPNHIDRSFSTPSPSSRETPTPPSSMSYPSAMLKSEMKAAMLKRRGESAFDINNIVIPYSMAASTRVEKLQYKEILTPKWRDVSEIKKELEVTMNNVKEEQTDSVAKLEEEKPETENQETEKPVMEKPAMEKPVMEKQEKETEELDTPIEPVANGLDHTEIDPEVAEELEDLSDEKLALRHMKCEIQEKKRFLTFVTITNKRGSRRTESGTTTPDPMSPDTSLNDSLFRTLSVASPTPPPTPALIKEISIRHRSNSLSVSRRTSDQDRLSICEDSMSSYEAPCVPPWPLRTFPLLNLDYDDLFHERPTEPEPIVMPKANTTLDSDGIIIATVPSSPVSDSSDSFPEEEDPNDPEWTCVTEEKHGASSNVGIVLKLKR